MDRENFYLKLPMPLQNLACCLEGARIQRSRFGESFSRILKEYEARVVLPHEEIIQFRDSRVREFVRHAYETTVFYRKQFDNLGIRPEDIRSLGDLKLLPILTKEVVQENLSEFISDVISQIPHVWVHTSGTTGGGLRFPTTLEAQKEQWATWWRYRKWHGITPDNWSGHFGGRPIVPATQEKPPFWRFNFPGKQILFSGYHMNDKNMKYYVETIKKKKIKWIHGYPSLLALLAGYVIENNIDLEDSVKWVTVGSENLLPQQCKVIKEAFCVYPIQHYGLAEGVANFSQCNLGHLHVDEDFAGVEFIPDVYRNVFRIIGTNFTNKVFPLLRYDTKDIVTVESDAICSCEIPGRIVRAIDGRKEDYIYLKDGTKVGRLAHVFADAINIKEAQIYQKEIGKIEIRLVPNDSFSSEDIILLKKRIMERTGCKININFCFVDKITKTKANKLRFVISDIQ